MAEVPVPVLNPNSMTNEVMMDTCGDVFNLTLGDQWWVAGKTAFPSPPQVSGVENSYARDKPQLQDFVPNYVMNDATTKYDSIPKQRYPELSPISQPFPGDSPISLNSEDRRSSAPPHPERRKRKRNTIECAAANSSGRRSSNKKGTQAAADETGDRSKTRRKSQETEAALPRLRREPMTTPDGFRRETASHQTSSASGRERMPRSSNPTRRTWSVSTATCLTARQISRWKSTNSRCGSCNTATATAL
ncbi:Uncharacterized protein HZ326_27309 [Fusarium oxysporum f. sp. albedinis]|nr:Uncharacterized protein HZ326_27309 [Fusarium oxysporum f. sp. albedinis]